jgi:hypothetical protein
MLNVLCFDTSCELLVKIRFVIVFSCLILSFNNTLFDCKIEKYVIDYVRDNFDICSNSSLSPLDFFCFLTQWKFFVVLYVLM